MVLPQNPHQLLTDLNTIAGSFNSLGGFQAVLASGFLSPIGIGLKKLKGIKDGEVMLWIMGAASLVAGFFIYLTSTPQHDPTIIAFLGFITFLASQPFYKLIFKPFFAWLGGQFSQAKKELDDQKNPASVPPEGLPTIGQ